MPLVSITRLRVRSFRYLPAFLVGSLRAARAAKNTTGNLAVSVLSDANLAFWTRTLWVDEQSMRAFMFAPRARPLDAEAFCNGAMRRRWTSGHGGGSDESCSQCVTAASGRRGEPPGSIILRRRN